jgi:hypothetical protein
MHLFIFWNKVFRVIWNLKMQSFRPALDQMSFFESWLCHCLSVLIFGLKFVDLGKCHNSTFQRIKVSSVEDFMHLGH